MHGIYVNKLFKWIRTAWLVTDSNSGSASRSNATTLVPVALATPTGSSSVLPAAPLEVTLPQVSLRFGPDREPIRVAVLVRLLGS